MMETPEVAVHDPRGSVASRDNELATADPEVVEKARRRRFSASYKVKLLEEVDRNPGQAGAILRREGLYSSHLSTWRKQRREGGLKALSSKRGPRGKSAEQIEIEKLKRDKARLERELNKVHILLNAQKSWPRSWAWIFRR